MAGCCWFQRWVLDLMKSGLKCGSDTEVSHKLSFLWSRLPPLGGGRVPSATTWLVLGLWLLRNRCQLLVVCKCFFNRFQPVSYFTSLWVVTSPLIPWRPTKIMAHRQQEVMGDTLIASTILSCEAGLTGNPNKTTSMVCKLFRFGRFLSALRLGPGCPPQKNARSFTTNWFQHVSKCCNINPGLTWEYFTHGEHQQMDQDTKILDGERNIHFTC